MKKLIHNFILVALLGFVVSFKIMRAETKTFYVDSVNGNDQNVGTDPKRAWKSLAAINALTFEAGSRIFLKCGSIWEGQLILKGSGTTGKPIKLSSYGSGKKPLINGQGKVEQVILLAEVEGWEIENLEITNPSSTIGNRTGILIRSLQPGTKKHFRLANLYIHDVMGDYSFEMKGKNTGGIGIIGGPSTKFDNLLIEHCEIGNINRVGIFTNLTNGDKATRGNRPFTNLVIRNNSIHHCAGDGVIIRYAYRPIISHNLAYENHNGPEKLVKHGVALWCRSTDEAVFEYNTVHHTRGKMDGQAFDADLDSYRTVVQYNYSYENEGGFMLVYGSSSESIVRYNLSVNDGKLGKHIFDFPVWTNPRGSGIFHNNTIILPKDSAVVIADEALPSAKFFKNVFYQQKKANLVIKSDGKSAEFLGNAYHGYQTAELNDSLAIFINHDYDFPLPNESTTYKQLKVNKIAKSINFGTLYWLPNHGQTDFWNRKIKSTHFVGAWK